MVSDTPTDVEFKLVDVAAVVAGQLVGPDTTVSGVSTDSRTISGGELFVPLVADRDGHDFIPGALNQGAAAYLTERKATGGSAVRVGNTATALVALGQHARTKLGPHVIGVTGSVGKTSVKDLLSSACSARGVYVNAGSFNNEIGLPLTLANAPADGSITVVEMGARGVGHIAYLCEIAQPTIGVVTAVALAHSEMFGSIDAVAQAKGELVEALPVDGVAVLNAADSRVAAMVKRTSATVVTFGQGGDFEPYDIELDASLRPQFRLRSPAGSVDVRLGVSGVHNVANAAAALAAAVSAEVPLAEAAANLADARLSRWRMEVLTTPAGATIINDSYNANPASMRAAFAALAELPAKRKVAVVGEMAELGEQSEEEHAAITQQAMDANFELVAVDAPAYGPDATHIGSPLAAVQWLGPVDASCAVLIKGSRSAGLEVVAGELTAT